MIEMHHKDLQLRKLLHQLSLSHPGLLFIEARPYLHGSNVSYIVRNYTCNNKGDNSLLTYKRTLIIIGRVIDDNASEEAKGAKKTSAERGSADFNAAFICNLHPWERDYNNLPPDIACVPKLLAAALFIALSCKVLKSSCSFPEKVNVASSCDFQLKINALLYLVRAFFRLKKERENACICVVCAALESIRQNVGLL